METNSLIKKVNWLLTTSLIVLMAALGLGGTLFISCEPAKSEEIARLDYTKDEMIARGNTL